MGSSVKCPECGSRVVEHDPEGERDDYECEECGEYFTKEHRIKPWVDPAIAAKKAFIEQAESLGLDPSLLGTVVVVEGTKFELIGLNTRAPRLPLIMRAQDDGHTMRCTPKWLCIKLKRPYAAPTADDKAKVFSDEMAKHGDRYELDSALIGRIFVIGKQRVKFLGLVPRGRKKPICIQRMDDHSYRVCTVECFYAAFGTMEPLPAPPVVVLPPVLPPTALPPAAKQQPSSQPTHPAVKALGQGKLDGQLSLFS
jgi:hypothetical protein